MTICIEAFLCPQKDEKISTSIAEGVALILKEKLDDRKEMKKNVQRLYGLRSVVAHGKRKTVMESDVFEMQQIVMSFISKMICFSDKMQTLNDLIQWIEDKKLK